MHLSVLFYSKIFSILINRRRKVKHIRGVGLTNVNGNETAMNEKAWIYQTKILIYSKSMIDPKVENLNKKFVDCKNINPMV